MSVPSPTAESRKQVLSRALKLIRRRRGLATAEIAARLGLAPRSYEYFEAGGGQLKVERVHRFARALDADPIAILAAIEIGSPGFAERCLENKLATIALMALADFDAAAGDDIRHLDPQTLLSAFRHTFEHLARLAQQRAAIAGNGGKPGGRS